MANLTVLIKFVKYEAGTSLTGIPSADPKRERGEATNELHHSGAILTIS